VKILLVSDIFYPHVGGISEHMLNLWKYLKLKGNDIKILAPSFGKNKPYDDPDFVRIGHAFRFPINKSISVVAVGMSLARQVKEFLERHDFDIIHVHGPLSPVLQYYAIKFSRTTNIITYHCAQKSSLGYLLAEPILEQYDRKLHGRIAVSSVARDSVARYFQGEYTIIPNGIDTQRFTPGNKPLSELNGKGPRILFLGRFEPRKGLKYLLQAHSLVMKEYPEARLIIAGQGIMGRYYRIFMNNRIKNNVLIMDNVANEILPRLYASCDIFCSPATGAESFGVVLLEAMASGKPIVATDIPGYRQVMSHGQEGFLCRPRDHESLAHTLIDLLGDRKKQRDMGMRGRGKAVGFDWEIVSGQILHYYHDIRKKYSGLCGV
jgi:phosphatidylinositol alpha-mannosyltransferase